MRHTLKKAFCGETEILTGQLCSRNFVLCGGLGTQPPEFFLQFGVILAIDCQFNCASSISHCAGTFRPSSHLFSRYAVHARPSVLQNSPLSSTATAATMFFPLGSRIINPLTFYFSGFCGPLASLAIGRARAKVKVS